MILTNELIDKLSVRHRELTAESIGNPMEADLLDTLLAYRRALAGLVCEHWNCLARRSCADPLDCQTCLAEIEALVKSAGEE
jgi:hypothetical protein